MLLTKIADEPIRYRAFFYLISYSGFRRSEMLGLDWKDIDFDNNIISVRRTSNYTAERGTYTDTTKTKLSQRKADSDIEVFKKYRYKDKYSGL